MTLSTRWKTVGMHRCRTCIWTDCVFIFEVIASGQMHIAESARVPEPSKDHFLVCGCAEVIAPFKCVMIELTEMMGVLKHDEALPGDAGGDMDRLPFLGGGGMPKLLGGARGPLGGARGPFGGGFTSGFHGGFRQH